MKFGFLGALGSSGGAGSAGPAPGPATHLGVNAPATATVGVPISVVVAALDALNNLATGYAGIVHITSSDGAAGLPADSTLVSGLKTFSVTLNTIGSQTVTGTDTVTGTITGVSGAIVVSGGGAGFVPTYYFLGF